MEIYKENRVGGDVLQLLQQHHQEMMKHSPPESVHALDTRAMQTGDLTFWKAISQRAIAGCGALKQIDEKRGEIKAMKTHKAFLRQGVAMSILTAIIAEGEKRGYSALYLETGSMAVFKPAHNLYLSVGFEYCGPFADYKEDPNSVFMHLKFT